MKVLVVYAHPNPESFNHAILDAFTKGLEDGGQHTFEVVDLYAINFDPCVKLEDLAQSGMLPGAPTRGQMPKDVLDQQEKVTQADALVFIYPVWWVGFPAILKGWIDRVFSHGFAYEAKPPLEVKGLLEIEKVLLISTTKIAEEIYESFGLGKAIKTLNEARFTSVCGTKQVEQVFLYAVVTDAEARKRYLELAYRLGKEF